MIDEKKIEEVANKKYFLPWVGSEKDSVEIEREAFKAGANWTLQEFKKSLWHDASEEPKLESLILCMRKTAIFHYMLDKNREEFQWDRMVHNFDIVKWCYVDDILPKEGGEQ